MTNRILALEKVSESACDCEILGSDRPF